MKKSRTIVDTLKSSGKKLTSVKGGDQESIASDNQGLRVSGGQPFDNLSPTAILEAAELFGIQCTGRLLQLNSMENRVYEVEIELGDHSSGTDGNSKLRYESFRVMKFYRPGRWTSAQILDEHLFLEQLSEADIPGVPPILTKHGESLVELTNGVYAAMFPRIGGRNPDELDKGSLLRLGRLIARMHQVGARVGLKERPRLNVQTYGYESLAVIERAELIPEEMLSVYRQTAERLLAIIEPWFIDCEFIRVHGDLHRGNILWNDEGPFFVDFDDMLSAPAAQDLWLIEPGRDAFALEAREFLIKGYEELRTFNRDEIRLFEALRTLRMIRYNGWIADRYHDEAFRRIFPMFTSSEYWRSELGSLVEQFEILSMGGVNERYVAHKF